MFHRYNTIDIDNGREAFRKLEEYLQQEGYLATSNLIKETESVPIVLP